MGGQSMGGDTIVKPVRRANSKEKRLESGIRCLLTQNGFWISSRRRMMTAPPRLLPQPLPIQLLLHHERRVQIIVEVPNMANLTKGLALLANRNGATGNVVTVGQSF